MPERVSLLFGVHAHQPSGNFSEVVDRAHALCYLPFLQTLAEYPAFRFAAHVSGPLLDQLAAGHPDDFRLLQVMAARGQLELFGAGDAEPVLAAIPHRDRIEQIERLSRRLAAHFGTRPQGAWLTERVWESAVVPALADCGVRYAIVDDYHFLCTGKTAADLDGYFTTEEDGRTLDLFAISEELRYRIPFAPAHEAVAYLEGLARPDRRVAAVYFDDIEKLGVWPETHDWVYARGWLREFIERVLASPAIETTHYAEFHARERTRGVVYLPATSYIEMNEWSLPAAAAAEYVALVQGEKQAGRYPARKGFLRGGIWRNFLSRYPEANWMHKRMLALSVRFAALPEAQRSDELRTLLHLAQANDAYWHGLFGGIYLPHLRRGVYGKLVELEARLDAIAERPAVASLDLDYDGTTETFVHNDALQIVVRGDGSAALRELDAYALAQNFGDTFRRHAEHYHRRVLDGRSQEGGGTGIASAHDRVSFKHAIGAADVIPDAAPRDLFRDTWIEAGDRVLPCERYRSGEPVLAESRLDFAIAIGSVRIEKTIALSGGTTSVRYRVGGGTSGTLRTTLDLAMPSCDGFGGRYIVDERIVGGFGQPLDLAEAHEVTLDDRFMKGSVTVRCAPPARIVGRPYHTVSQSEEGFERIMQSVTLQIEWSVAPPATFEVELDVRADPR